MSETDRVVPEYVLDEVVVTATRLKKYRWSRFISWDTGIFWRWWERTDAMQGALLGYFPWTRLGRKILADGADALIDYFVGGYKDFRDDARATSAVESMLTPYGSHTNPHISGGQLKPEYTQDELNQALDWQGKAGERLWSNTLEPVVVPIAACIAPKVVISAVYTKLAVDGYVNTEGTVGQKALGAVENATYGSFVKVMSNPELVQNFEKNPARTLATATLAFLQMAYPIAKSGTIIRPTTKPLFEVETFIGEKPVDAVITEIGPTSLKTIQSDVIGEPQNVGNPMIDLTSKEIVPRGNAKVTGEIPSEVEGNIKSEGPSKAGTVKGSLDGLTSAEKTVIDDLAAQGKNVEVIPKTTEAKTPDFLVNGVKTELKSLENPNLNTAITRIQKGFKQGAEVVIIDGRQAGLTVEQAEQILNRAAGTYESKALPGQVEIWTSNVIIRR